MSESARPARPRQRANSCMASDPAVSAFVAASAGSGKTKLLTDRLLRLMLAGARPERIQCLTFTKAAAAEMAVRLQKTLGRWVTLDDDGAGAANCARCASSRRSRRCATRARCSPRCSTCRAACASARSTRSASRCCGASRWRRRCRRISSLVDDRDAEDALTEAREDMLAHASAPRMRAALETLAGPRIGGSVRPARRDVARRSAAAAGGARAWRRPGSGAAPRARRHRGHAKREIIAHRGELAGGTRAARGGADRAAARREAMRRTRRTHPRLARPGCRGAQRTLAALVRRVPHQGRQAARRERLRSARRCTTRIPIWRSLSSTECDRIIAAIDACAWRCAWPPCRPRC